MLCGLPGALMILAPRAFYPDHAAGAAAWGLTLMEDQQLAGLIMWIPAGAIYIGAAAWLFVRMMRGSERRGVRLRQTALLSAGLCSCRSCSAAAATQPKPRTPTSAGIRNRALR